MSPEIPAEAERMKQALPYEAYRAWWFEHVLKPMILKRTEPRA
jgi:hypothetical protein